MLFGIEAERTILEECMLFRIVRSISIRSNIQDRQGLFVNVSPRDAQRDCSKKAIVCESASQAISVLSLSCWRFRGNSASSQKQEYDKERSRTTSFDRYISLRILWDQPGVAAQVSPGLLLWQFERGRGGYLCPGQTTQCSLVEADVVGDLSLTVFRFSRSRPLAMDTPLLQFPT